MAKKTVPEPIIVPLQLVGSSIDSTGSLSDRARNSSSDPQWALIEQFLQERSRSVNTRKAHQQDLRLFLDWMGKNEMSKFQDVSSQHMMHFKSYLLQEKHLSPTTVNRVLGTLKNFYKWMLDRDQISKNPASLLVPLLPPGVSVAEPKTQRLSNLEIARIYKVVTQGKFPQRDAALISVLLHGVRAEEAVSLNLENYDGMRLHLNSPASIQIEAKQFDENERTLPLKFQARQHLETYLFWRKQQGEILEGKHPLFLSYSRRSYGQRLSAWGIRDVIASIRDIAEIDLHPHRFRQTFVDELISKGIDPNRVRNLTRHKSLHSVDRYQQATSQIAIEIAFGEEFEQ